MLITASHNNRGTLNSIKEVQVVHPYESVSIVKQSIIMFLSEVLSNVIREEEENKALYSYLETGLIWLDTHDSISNFHLLFLLNLARFLGFYPDIDEYATHFNLLEGSNAGSSMHNLAISGEKLFHFKKLLGINFDAIHTISFNKKERQMVLQIIIRYFELQLEGFKEPKSLRVLETVFT